MYIIRAHRGIHYVPTYVYIMIIIFFYRDNNEYNNNCKYVVVVVVLPVKVVERSFTLTSSTFVIFRNQRVHTLYGMCSDDDVCMMNARFSLLMHNVYYNFSTEGLRRLSPPKFIVI